VTQGPGHRPSQQLVATTGQPAPAARAAVSDAPTAEADKLPWLWIVLVGAVLLIVALKG
jgi:hypothetical protein